VDGGAVTGLGDLVVGREVLMGHIDPAGAWGLFFFASWVGRSTWLGGAAIMGSSTYSNSTRRFQGEFDIELLSDFH